MNQGKLDVVKQETARVNVDILGIGELNGQEWKWKKVMRGFPGGCNGGDWGSVSGSGRLPGKRNGYPLTPVFCPREFHGHRTLAGYRMGEFNSDDHDIYYFGWESFRKNGVALIVNKKVQEAVLGTWMQSQKWQNNLSSVPRQSIQYHSNPSLCPNHWHGRSWSWPVMKTYKPF